MRFRNHDFQTSLKVQANGSPILMTFKTGEPRLDRLCFGSMAKMEVANPILRAE